jgi:hypothetical protein
MVLDGGWSLFQDFQVSEPFKKHSLIMVTFDRLHQESLFLFTILVETNHKNLLPAK